MDGPGIALRLLVYGQSALLLGVLLFAVPWSRRVRSAIVTLALAGIALCALAVLLLAQSLSENATLLDWPAVEMLLTGTPAGWAAIARIAAFAGVAVTAARSGARPLCAGLAIVAVATLVWNGHGAMTEGASGWLHLIGDAVHLVAGLAWIGAIAAFLWVAGRSAAASDDLRGDLERFAGTGTMLVALLLITGTANTLFIVGWDGLAGIFGTIYGELLLVKILLFAGMLAVAAANRFWLTPRLAASSARGALRASLATELTLGVGVLALVAWLGTLDPAQ